MALTVTADYAEMYGWIRLAEGKNRKRDFFVPVSIDVLECPMVLRGRGLRVLRWWDGFLRGEEKRGNFAKRVCKKPEAGYFKRLINQG